MWDSKYTSWMDNCRIDEILAKTPQMIRDSKEVRDYENRVRQKKKKRVRKRFT